MIAVAYGPPSMAVAEAELPTIREQADCVELRLDLFSEPFDLQRLLELRGNLPVVVTLRPPDEGGNCALPADQRLRVLTEAASLGAEYVDLEWNAATPEAVTALKAEGAAVIVSRHDFQGMPDQLSAWWREQSDQGADIVKVVGTAHHVRDCLPILQTLKHANKPTIAIAMGEPGLPSRILGLREDQCFLTYAAPNSGHGTAPGQLTIDDMRSIYYADRLKSTTKTFGLLGPHAEPDRIREYNAWFASDGIDAIAIPFATREDAPETVAAFQELPAAGWHIHGSELQSTVGQALDHLSSKACQQGKVNAIVMLPDQSLSGHWVESPREQYELWRSPS